VPADLKVISGTDPIAELAMALERHAAALRDGTLVADRGVLVLGNAREGLMHEPVLMGQPLSTSEAMGLLSFGQAHLFHSRDDRR
jgi:hypothetical protein